MEAFYRGRRVAAFSGFAGTASSKLDQLDATAGLRDLTRSTYPEHLLKINSLNE